MFKNNFNFEIVDAKFNFFPSTDDIAKSKIKLCPRCHSPHHNVNECTEFGDLKCPRCLEWDHWEDSCWTTEDANDLVSTY